MKKYSIIIAAIFIFYIIGSIAYNKLTSDVVTATITKTESKIIEGKNVYMVYTDVGVFRCEDQWLELKFNSSDVYSKLVPNKKITFKEVGIKNNYFSYYPNIIKIIKPPKE